LATHLYNTFHYPLYLTDEGIYTEQAWAVVQQGALSPYTYFYDHAPGGWLMLALWNAVLPDQSATFGNGINTGRVLMVIVHVASVFMLFQIAKHVSGGSYLAGSVAAFLFNFSPLAIYYQRQVLLDNMMVFWLLLATYLLVRWNNRVLTTMAAGLALGLALLTKENAIFFVPVLAYFVYRTVAGRSNRRFATAFWSFSALAPLGGYVMYATLKNELIPNGFNFDLSSQQTEHVSLLYTVWWQLNRSQEGIFRNFLLGTWMPRDWFLPVIGILAVLLNVYLGWRARKENPAMLVVPLLALGYAFYLVRGSVVLEFYILPIIPLLALNVGLAAAFLLRRLNNPLKLTALGLVAAMLFSPFGGYFLVHNDKGKLAVHDVYALSHTDLQAAQVDYIRTNVPPQARIIMDDDIWTHLHEQKPFYPRAHSHWKASSDPDVRDKLFRMNWRNIDYIVVSNKMREAMQGNNGDGKEQWIIEALDRHSQRIWEAGRGDVHVEIYQIIGQEGSAG
jgi:4-amino-4-deoxy-L-arabinose transferase-like glycosyltransferase